MKKNIFHLLTLFLFSIRTFAQPSDPGLQLGDKMPDISLGNYLNNSGRNMKVSDFKGKLLILDFWGTRCSSCIAHMPRMDSLQKQFGSKLQLVYVTDDDEKKVNELLSRVKVRKPDVPFFVSSKQVYKLFPHLGDPLHVWITPSGIVYAITEDYNTNEETVASFLNGGQPNLPRRWDWGLNRKYPLVSEQNGSLLHLANIYSVWLNGIYNYDVSTGIHILKDREGNANGLQLINLTLDKLYGFAYLNDIFPVPLNYFGLFKNNRLIFKLKDPSVVTGPAQASQENEWNGKNLYTYEMKLAPGSNKTVYDVLKKDIALRLPQYEAVIEKRKMNCIVLSDLSVRDEEKARERNHVLDAIVEDRDSNFIVQNFPVTSFLANLIYDYSYLDTPFISETTFRGNLAMKLKARPSNLQAFNRELNSYGFQIKIEEREIDMLVIRDKDLK